MFSLTFPQAETMKKIVDFHLIYQSLKFFSFGLPFSDIYSLDPIIVAKDGGKHFFAQLVALEELINVFTRHV